MNGEQEAVKETLNQYAIRLNSGDFESWISLWADNGVQMPPDALAVIGKEEIRKVMQPHFEQFNFKMTIHSIDDVKVSGDIGLTRATYTLKLIPKAGGETVDAMPDGKALTIFGRQSDGSWKIIFDCFNSNVAPPSPTPEST